MDFDYILQLESSDELHLSIPKEEISRSIMSTPHQVSSRGRHSMLILCHQRVARIGKGSYMIAVYTSKGDI